MVARDAHADTHGRRHTNAHTHTRMHTHTHACTHTCIRIHTMRNVKHTHTDTQAHRHRHRHTGTHVHAHTHTHTHTLTHTHSHTYAYLKQVQARCAGVLRARITQHHFAELGKHMINLHQWACKQQPATSKWVVGGGWWVYEKERENEARNEQSETRHHP